MISSIDIEGIKERANHIFEKIPKSKWRYYHKKSIDNFIFYLPKIKGKSEKSQLAEIINTYLDELESGFDEVDMQLSEYLFNTYVEKLVPIYQFRLGFAPVFATKALIVLVPMFAFIFLIAYANQYIFYLLLLLACIYYGNIIMKISKRKVYGFQY